MDHIVNVLSVTATASTIGLFFCGVPICRRIQQRGSTDGTSVAPFFLTSISCICWLAYGVIRNDSTVKFVNSTGLVFQSVFLAYYYINTRSKKRLNKLLLFEVLLSVGTMYYLYSSRPMDEKENLLGIICMMLNIATIGSPLADLGTVMKTKSTESLPFALCVMNMGVSVQWLAYGILVDDFYMKVPNAVAVIISAIQLSLFVIYPTKYTVLVSKGPNEIL